MTDWSAVEHAYGVATDIPPLLAQLRSSSRKDRDEAFAGLEDKLYHQGHRFDATVAALPHLFVALPDVTPPERARLVSFIHQVAVQDPDEFVCETDWSGLRRDLTFNAVRDSLAHVTALLTDEDESVRAESLALLADVPPDDVAPIRALLTDKNAVVRGLACLAIARASMFGVDVGSTAEIEHAARKGKGHEKPIAAAAWVQMAPSAEGVRTLRASLPKKLAKVRPFPFMEGSLFTWAFRLLTLAPQEHLSAAGNLLEVIAEPLHSSPDSSDLADACVSALFGPALRHDSPPDAWLYTAPEDLTSPKRALLELLIKENLARNVTAEMLLHRGLPVRPPTYERPQEGAQRYLGQLPETAIWTRLDGTVAGSSVRWPLYKWMRAVCLERITHEILVEVLCDTRAELAAEMVVQVSAHCVNVMDTPGYDRRIFVEIALEVVARRPELRPHLMAELHRVWNDESVTQKNAAFAAVVGIARALGGELPAEFDDYLPDVLRMNWEEAFVDLAVEVMRLLPASRREAIIARETTKSGLPFLKVPMGMGSGLIDAWDFLHLHSDPRAMATRAVRALLAWERPEEFDKVFRRKVTRAFEKLGRPGLQVLEGALRDAPADAPTTAVLRTVLAGAHNGGKVDAS
jgi:hypothetical protein